MKSDVINKVNILRIKYVIPTIAKWQWQSFSVWNSMIPINSLKPGACNVHLLAAVLPTFWVFVSPSLRS